MERAPSARPKKAPEKLTPADTRVKKVIAKKAPAKKKTTAKKATKVASHFLLHGAVPAYCCDDVQMLLSTGCVEECGSIEQSPIHEGSQCQCSHIRQPTISTNGPIIVRSAD